MVAKIKRRVMQSPGLPRCFAVCAHRTGGLTPTAPALRMKTTPAEARLKPLRQPRRKFATGRCTASEYGRRTGAYAGLALEAI